MGGRVLCSQPVYSEMCSCFSVPHPRSLKQRMETSTPVWQSFFPYSKMQTKVPFKMTVLSNGSKPCFFCFQFPLSKWDRGSACDVTTNKTIQLNINVKIQQIIWVTIIIQGFRSTSKRGLQERPHIGQLNSFIWFCWNHLNTFADLINTLCSCWLDSVFTTGAIYLWHTWWLPIRLRERHIFQ